MSSRRRSLVAALAFTVIAVPLRAQDSVRVLRPSSDLITREQIQEVKVSTTYELIETLHSNWLRERTPIPVNRATMNGGAPDTSGRAIYSADYGAGGKSAPGSSGGIQVYFDGTRVGGLAELKTMRPADIYSIQRINGVDAQARFGIGHSAGVLFISSITRQKQQD